MDEVMLNITGSGAEMEGVARLDGMAVFVPGALPGECVRARIVKRSSRYARAEIVEVISASPDRRTPECPAFGECGGCGLMHMSYSATLERKAQYIVDCLERIGGVKLPPCRVLGMERPYGYRNRVQFPVGGSAQLPRVGFYRGESHEVIDLPQGCVLIAPQLNKARAAFVRWLRANTIPPYDKHTRRGLVRHVVFRQNRSGQFMAIVVVNGRKLPNAEELWRALKPLGCISLMLNVLTDVPVTRRGAEVMGREFICLRGASSYVDEILGCQFDLSAPSFFQINAEMTDKLYSLALEFAALRDGETLLDAYCGAGTIGLTLLKLSHAPHSRLIGIESVAEAVDNARRNAELNGLNHARFICGRCERELSKLVQGGLCPDAAVVDPPRKGCDAELLSALVELGKRTLNRIVYVSCNPATLARDVNLLIQSGWGVERVVGVDMFPWTGHVETVVLMSRAR